jgi:WD40 repeat protein/tRNA A-37 threonylcarbamoyl transferase component Bud32/predicted esterase
MNMHDTDPDQEPLPDETHHTRVSNQPASADPLLPELPPGYQFLRVLGRGGMGIVVQARQIATERIVALKLIRAGRLANRHDIARFQQEARSLGRLQHPNIVQIYEAGQHDGQFYLALEYCPGGALERQLTPEPLDPRRAADLLLTLARTVAVAHAAQVIHRDLKPDNVLLTDTGTLKIADFGLARRLDSDERLTESGVVVGTPAYLSPEQALDPNNCGPASDVWALGVLFYRLLTGRLPFMAFSSLEVLRAVVERDPVAPRSLAPGLPRDVETICLTCLHKHVGRRYPSATALADDLERWQRGEPIHARPVGIVEQATKWVRRNPVVTALSFAVVAALGFALTATSFYAVQARRAAQVATQAQLAAEAQQRNAEVELGRNLLLRGISHCVREEVAAGLNVLSQALVQVERIQALPPPTPDALAPLERAVRTSLAWWQHRLAVRPYARLPHADWIWDVAYSPNGLYVASISKDGTARVWEARTGEALAPPFKPGGFGRWLTFTPDSRRLLTLAVVEGKGQLRAWDIATGQPAGPVLAANAEGWMTRLAVRPDGAVWVQTGPRTLTCLDPVTGKAVLPALNTPAAVDAFTLSHDGQTLVASLANEQLLRWHGQTGITLNPLPLIHQRAAHLHLTPAGTHLLVGTEAGSVPIIDLVSGQMVQTAHLGGRVMGLASSRDGRQALVVGVNHQADAARPGRWLRVDLPSGQAGPVMLYESPLWGGAIAGDGQTALLAAEDGRPVLWSLLTGQRLETFTPQYGPRGNNRTVAVHPDGRRFVCGSTSSDTSAVMVRVEPPPLLSRPLAHPAPVTALQFTPDGEHLLSACAGSMRLWKCGPTPELVRQVPLPTGLSKFVFSPDLRRLVAATETGPTHLRDDWLPGWRAEVWEVSTGRRLFELPRAPFSQAVVHPDSQSVLVNAFVRPGHVTRFDLNTGTTLPLPIPPALANLTHLDLVNVAPTGTHWCIGSTGAGQAVGGWAATGAPQVWRLDETLHAAMFAPDGQSLATLVAGGRWQVWSLATGGELAASTSAGSVGLLGYRPDGQSVWLGTAAGLQVYDLTSGQPLGPLWPAPQPVTCVAWHPNGHTVAVADASGAVQIWHLPTPVVGSAEQVQRWMHAVTRTSTERGQPRYLPLAHAPGLWAELAHAGAPVAAPAALRIPNVSVPALLQTPESARERLPAPRLESPPLAVPPLARVLPPVGTGGRNPVLVDWLEAQRVAGTLAIEAGARVTLPGQPARTWTELPAQPDGSFRSQALVGGYLQLVVAAPTATTAVLEAQGHTVVFVNGVPRTGDPYQTGTWRVPIALQAGRNELLFQCVRGQLSAKLLPAERTAQLHLADVTRFDGVVGVPLTGELSVPVLNTSIDPLRGLVAVTQVGEQPPVRTPVPPLLPTSVRKCAVTVRGPAPTAPGELDVALWLETADGMSVDRALLKLSVVPPTGVRRVTFRSQIDDSVQYYAVVPPVPPPTDLVGPVPQPGLVLTLHGASVEALSQAQAYAAKPDLLLVAPTNRRPFGFDWEDWGRRDAIEVLEHAQRTWAVDRPRTYLTGHSMGGHGTWHLGLTYPERFAVIGPSAGWVSMWSYAGVKKAAQLPPVVELVQRAMMPSDTLALSRNAAGQGVYVLHGEADDNVPVDQARQMRAQLQPWHPNFLYHEEPRAGHWWSRPGSAGAACVDWPPLFDLMRQRRLPSAPHQVEFVTANPAISARHHWATIVRQEQPLLLSRIVLDYAAGALTGTTENVRLLALDLPECKQVDLDGDTVRITPAERWYLQRTDGHWRQVLAPEPSTKGPHRSGPFKEAFGQRMVFVYGTHGTPAETAWGLAKARFDAEVFAYRGNGSVEVLADRDADWESLRDRSVIVYGHAECNRAWAALLANSPIQVFRDRVQVGERIERGPDLACLCVRPRLESDSAYVGIVAGTGLPGLRLTERLPVFVSGVAYPDWLVFDTSSLTRGSAGWRGAGYFDDHWRLPGVSAWRE